MTLKQSPQYTAEKAEALRLAIKHVENARKAIDKFHYSWNDDELHDQSKYLLQQLNRLRNIEFGRRFWTNDGN